MNKEIQDKISEKLQALLEKMDIPAGIKFLEELNKDDRVFKVEINSRAEGSAEDANLLIGYHGDTLNSLQHVLNIMLFREYGKSFKVILDVSDYRKERERKLVELAINAADKARFINKSIALFPMNSYERKIVHEKIGGIDGVTSSSEGEGYNRRVIIVPSS